MDIRATLHNAPGSHRLEVSTNGSSALLPIPGQPAGGSAVNGGELLCAALATCYCNDLYREAARQNIEIAGVEVEVASEFGGPGDPARRISYRVRVTSSAPPEVIEQLIRDTDACAEVHNTLRAGLEVELDVVPPQVS